MRYFSKEQLRLLHARSYARRFGSKSLKTSEAIHKSRMQASNSLHRIRAIRNKRLESTVSVNLAKIPRVGRYKNAVNQFRKNTFQTSLNKFNGVKFDAARWLGTERSFVARMNKVMQLKPSKRGGDHKTMRFRLERLKALRDD